MLNKSNTLIEENKKSVLLKELLLPDDLPYDLTSILKQAKAAAYFNYSKHLQYVLSIMEQKKQLYPQLENIDMLKLFNLRKHIKQLRFCPNDSISYEVKGSKQYRLVFNSIDKSNKYQIEDYEHYVTKDGVIVYMPYLSCCANIKDDNFNSLSIYTIGRFEKLQPNDDVLKIELRTTIPIDVKAELKPILSDSYVLPYSQKPKIIKEMFQKYMINMNVDLILKKIRTVVLTKMKNFLVSAIAKFNKDVEEKSLDFLKGFNIGNFFDINIVQNLNFDLDKSSTKKLYFSNIVGKNQLKAVFQFHNGAIMYEPTLGALIDSKDVNVDNLILETSIRFDNIPTDTKYYLNTASNQYIFEYKST